MPASSKPKKYCCAWEGCDKSFTRSDHLQRHILNHSSSGSTCPRCSLHFKRPDLLDRHMARHRQRDAEAGGEGLGVIESRKKLWRDSDGSIVSKRPAHADGHGPLAKKKAAEQHNRGEHPPSNIYNFQTLHTEPLSPPKSMLSTDSMDPSPTLIEFFPDRTFSEPTNGSDMFDFLANSSWGSTASSSSICAGGGMPSEDMFNPDTASSFNMPFTTMNNYNWLFDVSDMSRPPHSLHQDFNYVSNTVATEQDPIRPDVYQNIGFTNEYSYIPDHTAVNPPQNFNTCVLQPEATRTEEVHPHESTVPPPDRSSYSKPPQTLSISPHSLRTDSIQTPSEDYSESVLTPTETYNHHSHIQISKVPGQGSGICTSFAEIPLPQPQSIHMPTMDEVSRNEILKLVVNAKAKTPEGTEITAEHPLLTLSAMQNYLDLFFSRFNVAYPLLHQATFDPSKTETLLLLAVLLLGATYSEKSIHRLAVCIHDVLRGQIFQHSSFSAVPELWVLQTILLVECFGKSRAGQKQHDMAHLFHGLLINLIRRSDCQTVRAPNVNEASGDLESDWKKAIDFELRKRLAFLCFLWDTQHAVLFSQSLCMSSFELRTTLPCNQATWEARSAEDWWKHAKKEPQISFLSVLKSYMNPDSVSSIPELNALSRLLVLHGLMSIQWDMRRRDQTSLGFEGANGLVQATWQDRTAHSYDAWKADFDTYCMNMSFSLDTPSRKAEFLRFSTATTAIYHAAHITLNVEILDLQIYAGARHIIGRPVARADYDRSRRVVKEWAKPGGSTPAAKAAWHAAHLLRDGILNLDNWDVNNAFHYPWCLYIATLTCWAFHFATSSNGTQENMKSAGRACHRAGASLRSDGGVDDGIVWHAKSEMNALVSSMTSGTPENLWRVIGKYTTSGLTAVMAKHLSNVRWAVVHEGMKVLRGLVPERSINEYEAFLR